MRVCLMCVAVACIGCGTAEPNAHVGASWLDSHQIGITETASDVSHLHYHALDEECVQVYRISVTYDHNPPRESDSVSWLSVGPHPRRRQPDTDPGPVAPGATHLGRLFYDGLSVGKAGATRDVYLSSTAIGPAAPSSACYPRTWDPMDDALTLGWPALTGRLTAVGEHWRGARVEGRCNRTACIDPETYAMGADVDRRSCVTRDWEETLVGLFRVGNEQIAAIESTWDDGHPLVSATRHAVVSVTHGRPVWTEVEIHHRPPQLGDDNTWKPVHRTWRFESVDDCPGSLAALGWTRPEDIAQAHGNATTRFGLDEDQRRAQARRERRHERAQKAQAVTKNEPTPDSTATNEPERSPSND